MHSLAVGPSFIKPRFLFSHRSRERRGCEEERRKSYRKNPPEEEEDEIAEHSSLFHSHHYLFFKLWPGHRIPMCVFFPRTSTGIKTAAAGAVINRRLPSGESAISFSRIRTAGRLVANAKLLDDDAIYIPSEIKCVNYLDSRAEFRCCRWL